ncbi:cytochrome P450 4C1-like [Chelonus insularis]|uniref:cytochrome P450 4C1-like n=1 Tax=Chelonus insularis TaxID=460826 RepID=UPI00158F32F3|nr:cytochrome P450 4C1-like [Chelonus insularis]
MLEVLSSLFSTFTTLSVVTLILFHFYVHGRRIGRITDKIPGPRWYPIIGNALDLLVPTENIWHFFRRSGRDFYPVYKFWVGTFPIVNIRHPDDIQAVLSSSKNIEKNHFYKFLHPWLQDGLLTSTGNKWRTHRKILTPAFHLHNLKEYSSSIIEHTNRLVKSLKTESTSEGIIKELHPLLTKFTLNTICESAMGMNITENDEHQNKYKKAVCDFGNLFYYRFVRPWLENDFIFSLTKKGKEQKEILKILHGFSKKIIKERTEYHQETRGKYLHDFSCSYQNNTGTQATGKGKRKRLAFLDLLIAASKQGLGIDAREIQEEVDTFVFEGHDTTATCLVFTILLLAENKEAQTRAREEVIAALEQNDGKLTMDAIQQCTYLEQCIKESLRLYPSLPVIGRKIDEDLQLKHAFIPKGSIVVIHIFDVHRDVNFWSRPNVFDPDRFRPENTESRHPFAYVPFSAGPRNCIGQKFAMLELKLLIAGLLQNFYIEPEDVTSNISILPDLMLKPVQPAHAKFVPIMR